MTDDHGTGHDGARSRRARPPVDQVARGLGLTLLGLVLVSSAGDILRRAGWWGTPIAVTGLFAGAASLWAAVIHLTGGERFDDHPFL